MRRAAPLAGLLATAAFCAACHLVQPRTYLPGAGRADRLVAEYLAKELVAGMPEPLFVRWYTRDDAWRDGRRPFILAQEKEDGRTAYDVGWERRTIGKVFFENGALVEYGFWDLQQEAFISSWRFQRVAPRVQATPELLARLETLDPVAEVWSPEADRSAWNPCRLERGMTVETLMNLLRARRDFRTWIGTIFRWPGEEEIVPQGTRLHVREWRGTVAVLEDTRDGRRYRANVRDVGRYVCPVGQCAFPRTQARLSRDLVLGAPGASRTSDRPVLFAPWHDRVPVWTERQVLPAGTAVTLLEQKACSSAWIALRTDGRATWDDRIEVPFAPPGLFVPAAAAPKPDRGDLW